MNGYAVIRAVNEGKFLLQLVHVDLNILNGSRTIQFKNTLEIPGSEFDYGIYVFGLYGSVENILYTYNGAGVQAFVNNSLFCGTGNSNLLTPYDNQICLTCLEDRTCRSCVETW